MAKKPTPQFLQDYESQTPQEAHGYSDPNAHQPDADPDDLGEGEGAEGAEGGEAAGGDVDDEAGAQTPDAVQRQSVVRALGLELLGKFTTRKGQRAEIERRWQEDLRQYNSVYTQDLEKELKERPYGSKVFVPMTRRICNAVEARLGDLLFPTDDRNFAVEASPDQSIGEAEALALRIGNPNQEIKLGGGLTMTAEAARAQLREMREENTTKATRMQRVIDDQLKECGYSAEGRKAIHNAIKLGTGVMKGPYVLGKTKRKWIRDETGKMVQVRMEQLSATAVCVDTWLYYPDLSVGEIQQMDGHFELHPMNKAQLAALAQSNTGFDHEAIEMVVRGGADYQGITSNDAAQREASGNEGIGRESYNLVEYNGPVDHDKLVAWGAKLPEDPLAVYQGVVWFHEGSGVVVKAIVSPLDSDESPYSVFNWQKDTACVFGYGLPFELRDIQTAGNSTFRAMLDNIGLSVGGQTVVDDTKVKPANGRWAIEPNKLWKLTATGLDVQKVFGHFKIDSLAGELLNVFGAIKNLADEIGGPQAAMQGQDAPSWLQAGATGAALAYNASNILMRRAVRNFDDQITTPLIGRFIDWNMQYHEDDSVKGDLNAIARGSSALMEADGMVGKLALVMKMSQEMGIPIRRVVAQLRKVVENMRLNAEDLIPNDAEIKQMEDERAKNGPPPNPEMERLNIRKMEIMEREKDRQHEVSIKDREMEIRMAEIADRNNMTIEQARTRFGVELRREAAKMEHELTLDDRETQRMNAEIAVKAQRGSGI